MTDQNQLWWDQLNQMYPNPWIGVKPLRSMPRAQQTGQPRQYIQNTMPQSAGYAPAPQIAAPQQNQQRFLASLGSDPKKVQGLLDMFKPKTAPVGDPALTPSSVAQLPQNATRNAATGPYGGSPRATPQGLLGNVQWSDLIPRWLQDIL